MCRCMNDAEHEREPVNRDTGEVCDLGEEWAPAGVPVPGLCVCKEKCIREVYETIFLRALTIDMVRFPQRLPGLDAAKLRCLVKLDGDAASLMGAVSRDGVTEETVLWTVDTSNVSGHHFHYTTSDAPAFKDIRLETNTDVWGLGDLHGRLGSLRQVNLDWRGAEPRPYIAGLGDMIDRGNRQLEVFAGMIAWRAMFPHSVSFVRGNHESSICRQYGFYCVDKGSVNTPYPDQGLFLAFKNFFNVLPVAMRIRQPNQKGNGVFMHGGWGPEVHKKLLPWSAARSPTPLSITNADVQEIMWSESHSQCVQRENMGHRCRALQGAELDKDEEDIAKMFPENEGRGAGYFRTHTATRQFMKAMGSCILMVGHSHVSTIETVADHGAVGASGCAALDLDGAALAHGLSQLIVLTANQFQKDFFVDVDLDDDNAAESGASFRSFVNLARQLTRAAPTIDPIVRFAPDKDPTKNRGTVGTISFGAGGQVRVGHRYVFPTVGSYDEVSEWLDIGVPGGSYPQVGKQCEYLVPNGRGRVKYHGDEDDP